jgi:putative nucleotidyltransferase with HDIG domain
MTEQARHIAAAEELVRRFSGALKAVQLYSPEHPLVARATDQLAEHVDGALAGVDDLVIGVVDRQVVVDDVPLTGGPGAAETSERFRAIGLERLVLQRGVTRQELVDFLRRFAACRPARGDDADEALQGLASTHIRVGRLHVQQRAEAGRAAGTDAIRATYQDAVAGAERLWEQTSAEGSPDPVAAQSIVESLASAVGQNRRAMMALTAMFRYDNYTFTHMVNVSVLTMAQARGIGFEGALLRQFGLAGLMHDIGKIRTPPEILSKPDKLTDSEFEIMQQHPVEGAEMLRRHLELPPLAAIVAFEHHLRVDGTGYPSGVRRPALNLATQLCSIADVYDAMRSKREYQQAFPTDRIIAVLKQHDGARFDQNLVRRFSQLMGIYPVGNVVRLDSGALAVVLRVHAPDPSRPTVRVVVGPDGRRLPAPVDLALWAEYGPNGAPPRIVCPVDPAEAGFDPLTLLDDTPA